MVETTVFDGSETSGQMCIANFGTFLDVFEFLSFGGFFLFFKKIGFLGILGPPYCGISATIRIGRETLCLPYAGFLSGHISGGSWWKVCYQQGLPNLVFLSKSNFFF